VRAGAVSGRDLLRRRAEGSLEIHQGAGPSDGDAGELQRVILVAGIGDDNLSQAIIGAQSPDRFVRRGRGC